MISMEDQPTEKPAAQETDVWWGAYSGWTLLPSLLVCVALTAAIVWGALTFVERRYVQWTFWSLAGLVWIVQLVRLGRRVFGINYRLTSKRLFLERGHWRSSLIWIDLATIVDVGVRPVPLGNWTGVGNVVIGAENGDRFVLRGVHRPHEIARLIRDLSERIRQPIPTPAPGIEDVPAPPIVESAVAAPSERS